MNTLYCIKTGACLSFAAALGLAGAFMGQECNAAGTTTSQIFTQDFSSGPDLSTYIGTGQDQFTGIEVSGGGFVWSIDDESLLGTRSGSNTGALVKNGLATSAETGVVGAVYSFDFELLQAPSASLSTSFRFMTGSDFSLDTVLPDNSSINSRFAIYILSNGSWCVRDIDAGVNGSTFYSGNQTVTFVTNTSDASLDYLSPGGTTITLAANSWSVWIGTDLALSGAATTSSVDPTAFNLRFAPNGSVSSSISLDNINVQTLTLIPEASSWSLGAALFALCLCAGRRFRQ